MKIKIPKPQYIQKIKNKSQTLIAAKQRLEKIIYKNYSTKKIYKIYTNMQCLWK